jgi:hypothetical protein
MATCLLVLLAAACGSAAGPPAGSAPASGSSSNPLRSTPPSSAPTPSGPPSTPSDTAPTKQVRYTGVLTADQATGCVLLTVPSGVMYALLGIELTAMQQGGTAEVRGYHRLGVRTPCGDGLPVLQVVDFHLV